LGLGTFIFRGYESLIDMIMKNILKYLLAFLVFLINLFVLFFILIWLYLLLDNWFHLLASTAEGLIIIYFPLPFFLTFHPLIFYFLVKLFNIIFKDKNNIKFLKIVIIQCAISLVAFLLTIEKVYILIFFPKNDLFLILYLIIIILNIIVIIDFDNKKNKRRLKAG